jgi:hypothetical protein
VDVVLTENGRVRNKEARKETENILDRPRNCLPPPACPAATRFAFLMGVTQSTSRFQEIECNHVLFKGYIDNQ